MDIDSSFSEEPQADVQLPQAVEPYQVLSEEKVGRIFKDLQSMSSPDEIFAYLRPLEEDIKTIQTIFKTQTNKSSSEISESVIVNPASSDHLRTTAANEFTVFEAERNGDCFYNAVSTGLFGHQRNRDHVRLLNLYHLLENKQVIEPVFHKAFNYDYIEVVKSTKTNASNAGWGNEANSYITSGIIGRPIIVHQPSAYQPKTSVGNSEVYNFDPSSSNSPLYIYLRGQHFEPLIPKVPNPKSICLDNCQQNRIRLNGAYNYIGTNADPNAPIEYTDEQLEEIRKAQVDDYLVIQQAATIDKIMKQPSIASFLHKPQNTAINKTKSISEDIAKATETTEREPEANDNYEKMQTDNSKSESSASEHESPKVAPSDEHIDSVPSSNVNTTIASEFQEDMARSIRMLDSKVDKVTELVATVLRVQQGGAVPAGIQTKYVDMGPQKAEAIMSIEELLRSYPFLKLRLSAAKSADEKLETFNEIVCVACNEDNTIQKDGQNPGVFSYESSTGVSFVDGQAQPRKFINLKKNIKKHIQTAVHCKSLQVSREWSKTMVKKNKAAGMVIGKLAYTSLKLDHNMSRFEDLVAIQASMGTPVGEINHSRKFARSFCQSVYNRLLNQLKDDIAEPLASTGRCRPLSLIADKITPDRRSGQVVGLVMFHGDKIRDFNLDFARVELPNYTGSGIADLLQQSMLKVLTDKEEMKTR